MELKSVYTGNKDLVCPCCKTLNDAAASESGAQPKQGDISICFYCGSILSFVMVDSRLRLEKAKDSLLTALRENHPDMYAKMIKYSSIIALKNRENSRRYS